MKVTLDFASHVLVAEKEPGDPNYYGVLEGKGESNLLYAIKEELIHQGYDVIKKRMWKDGHLMDDMQQYIRTRHYMTAATDTPGEFAAFNDHWAIEGIEKDWNERGRVELRLET